MTDIYRAIADPTRRKILTLLSGMNIRSPNWLIDLPFHSRHKKASCDFSGRGLGTERKEGRYRVYSLKRTI